MERHTQRVDDLDYSHAHLHGPSFEGARVTDGFFANADFSGDLKGLRLNGVDVAPLVMAELERREPERILLRATTPDDLRAAWRMTEARAANTLARFRQFPERLAYERVSDEWSYVETLRHLILATDCWLRRMVYGQLRPYSAIGLAGSWLLDPTQWGINPTATPTLDDVLAVRDEHVSEVRSTLADITVDELARECRPPDTPGHPTRPHTVLACIHVLLNEEWEHDHYVTRDLDILVARGVDEVG